MSVVSSVVKAKVVSLLCLTPLSSPCACRSQIKEAISAVRSETLLVLPSAIWSGLTHLVKGHCIEICLSMGLFPLGDLAFLRQGTS